MASPQHNSEWARRLVAVRQRPDLPDDRRRLQYARAEDLDAGEPAEPRQRLLGAQPGLDAAGRPERRAAPTRSSRCSSIRTATSATPASARLSPTRTRTRRPSTTTRSTAARRATATTRTATWSRRAPTSTRTPRRWSSRRTTRTRSAAPTTATRRRASSTRAARLNAQATNDYGYGRSSDQLQRAAGDYYHSNDQTLQGVQDQGLFQIAAALGPAFQNFLAMQKGS
jgi:hypothetical protein